MMDNELYHHGVLGMKWGVRKDDSSGGGSSRRRAIRRGALIAAGVLATGAVAYGLYRTGAYKKGVDVVQLAFSGAKTSAKKQLVSAKNNAVNTAKKKVVETLDDQSKINAVQNKVSTAQSVRQAFKARQSNGGSTSKARYQASKDIYEANKAYKARAEQTARKAASQKVNSIPKETRDAGKKRLGKIFERLNRNARNNQRSVDRFNEQNARFVENLGKMQ